MKKFIIIANSIFIYLVAILFVFIFSHNKIAEWLWEKVFFNNAFIPLYLILQFGIIMYIVNFAYVVRSWNGTWSARELAHVNMLVKLIQIPAYILIFVAGVACLVTIFTVGISIALILLDCFSIGMTGLLGVAAFRNMRREGKISSTKQVVCSIGSFIFCVDVILAIVGYRGSKS